MCVCVCVFTGDECRLCQRDQSDEYDSHGGTRFHALHTNRGEFTSAHTKICILLIKVSFNKCDILHSNIKSDIIVSLCSPQYALHVYNEVMSVGQKYGIHNAGYYALRSLRIETFFAFWGQDLDSFTTPLECGREFRVKFDKVCSAV